MHKNYNYDTNGSNLTAFRTTYTKMSSLSSSRIWKKGALILIALSGRVKAFRQAIMLEK